MNIFKRKSDQKLTTCRIFFFALVTISILIFSLYSNTFRASWHFDDEQTILDNHRLHLTEISPQTIIKTFYSAAGDPGRIYRPVACLSLALNYYFGKTNVFGYHLINILIHLITSLFLFLFIYDTLNLPLLKAKYGPNAYSIALLSAVLWAVNPIQTQAITYIVQRMASMAAMFYIMAMYFYLKGRTAVQHSSRFLWYLFSFAAGIFSFGSKENAAMLPFSLFLFDLFLIQGLTRKSIKNNAAILAAVIFIPLVLALILNGASFFNLAQTLSGYEQRGFTLGQRLLTEPRVIVYYISLLFYPMPNRLCITHVITPSHGLLHPPTELLSVLLILLILSTAIVKSRKWPLICYCIVFFFLNHVIESTIFPLELIFEHRNYLPSMLFFVPVSILFIKTMKIFTHKPFMKFTISGFVVLMIIGFGHSTFMRNFIWKTEETLWMDAVDKNPDSLRAHHNLGRYYADNGATEKAILEYRYALKLKPETYGEKSYLTHYNLGLAYMAVAKYEEAMQQFQKAIDIFPGFADAYCDMAIIMTSEGNYEKAYNTLITSLTYDRNNPQAHNNLGYVLIKKNEYKKAVIELQKALELDQGYHIALLNMGIAYKHEKEFKKAIHSFRSAMKKNPRDVLARLHLAETYAVMGKADSANRLMAETLDLIGPRKLYPIVRKLLGDTPFLEIPRKSIFAPLLKKAYVDRGKFFEEMGNELLKFSENNRND